MTASTPPPGTKFLTMAQVNARNLRKWVGELEPPKFPPLVSWPASPHPEQARLDQYRAYPSRTC
ncbi:MAG: hypothetical protein Q7R45_04835 [Sulfuricaulis sp.]|nr:hypothetical protein [Sulfuricaulis sp.]